MRLLHASDLHLDSAYARLDKTSEQRAAMAEEQRQVFSGLVDLARELQPDALVIPGDLLMAAEVYEATLTFMGEEFARLGETPVLVAPGNHDPYVFYRRRVKWPANVHIFGPEWQSVEVGDEVVWGFGHNQSEELRRLVPLVPTLDLDMINVLAFHGMDLGSPQEHRSFAPFTAGEIRSAGFDYAALGHYHRAAAVGDAVGVIGAYSGALRGWGRPGNGRYAVLVEVGKESCVSTQYIAEPGGFRPNESPAIPLDADSRHADWPKRAWNRR